MKFIICSIACLAVCFPVNLLAQSDLPPVASEQQQRHQVGLIDMAYVFKNYEKFLSLTEALQQDISKTDKQAKEIVDRVLQLQTQLKSGDLTEGSTEFRNVENQIVQGKTELETFKRQAQRSFLRQEAEIYKTVYLDVEDVVRRYATHYKYTLILRFDREQVDSTDNPRDVMNGMNRQVVHYNPQDDITEPVLRFLNNQWKKQGGEIPKNSTSLNFLEIHAAERWADSQPSSSTSQQYPWGESPSQRRSYRLEGALVERDHDDAKKILPSIKIRAGQSFRD